LIIPFYVVSDKRTLILGGVDPINPWAPFMRVYRSSGAEYDHGRAVAPGVENGHGGVH
jgi:hypothetical protein